jgi:adenylate cyclase class 2
MYEVELKVAADHDVVRPQLESLGAEPSSQVQQVDTYFDAPHREFADTDEALRVRTEESDQQTTTELTYKGPLVEEASKTREELTTELMDQDTTREILEALGFEHSATVRKQRERFAYGDFTITLDAVDRLGEFLEIETEVETEADVEPARKRAVEILEKVGLDVDEQIRRSYLELTLTESEENDDMDT